jgi:hypothetical protein
MEQADECVAERGQYAWGGAAADAAGIFDGVPVTVEGGGSGL